MVVAIAYLSETPSVSRVREFISLHGEQTTNILPTSHGTPDM
jgi:hypothetical protein